MNGGSFNSEAVRAVVQCRHSGAVQAVSFSLEGDRFITASADGSVRVWCTRTGRLLRMLAEGQGDLRCLDLSRCGRFLLYAGAYRGVTVLAWPSGEVLAELDSFPGGVMTACFHPDGERILVGQGRLWARERSVEMWRWRDMFRERVFYDQTMENMEYGSGCVGALAVSPDGRTVAAGIENRLVIWGEEWNVSVPAHALVVTALVWSPHGDYLISTGCDKRVALWRPGSEAPERSWSLSEFSNSCVAAVAVAPDSCQIAAVCDRQILLIDPKSGEEQSLYGDNIHETLHAVAYAPHGDRWLAGHGSRWLLWQGTERLPLTNPEPACAWDEARLHGNGTITAVTYGAIVACWNVQQEIVKIVSPPEGRYAYPALSPDGRWRLASVWGVGEPQLTDLRTGASRPIALSPTGNYNRSAFTRDWAVLVDTRLHLLIRIHPETLTTATAITDVKSVSFLAAANDANLVMVGDSRSGRLTLWDMETLQQKTAIPFKHESDACCAIAPDGNSCLVAPNRSGDRNLHLLDTSTGETLNIFEAVPHGELTALTFSPDSKHFASGQMNGRVLLWHVEQPQPLADWKVHGRRIDALGFSPDGAQLLSGGDFLLLRRIADGAELRRLYLFEPGDWVVTDFPHQGYRQ